MVKILRLIIASAGFVAALLFGASLLETSARAQDASKVQITTVVTILGPKFSPPPAIAKEDVVVFSGKTRLDVVDWAPAQGENSGLQLAIVIDNSASRFGLGSQLNELADFITQQSAGTEVGVFYAVSGTVQAASPFSKDYASVGRTLRTPMNPRTDNSPSVYMSFSDLVNHHWRPTGGRREVLLLSSGADGMNRGPASPYVQAAVADAQKAGVIVDAIYTFSGGVDQSMGGQYGQSNLKELAEETGGYNLFDGASTPMSFQPYLQQLGTALQHQYRLTFAIEPRNKSKSELREIKIRTEQHHVDLRYPKEVFVPVAAK